MSFSKPIEVPSNVELKKNECLICLPLPTNAAKHGFGSNFHFFLTKILRLMSYPPGCQHPF